MSLDQDGNTEPGLEPGPEQGPDDSSSIAIIGMAGRFPDADDLETLWDNLAAGRESISRFSDPELAEAGVPPEVRALPNFVPARAILSDPDYFDAPLFGMTPIEAQLTDPQHRVFLECAWTALENGGYDPGRYDGLIGVYAGADVNSYATGHLLMWTHDLQSLIGNDKDYLATRLAWKLDLRGPAVTVQSACSTSLVAVQTAVQALLSWQCDMALAGGVGIAFPQKAGYLYAEGGILSPDGHCRPFDADAAGTVGGDGCGVVLLKRLVDAIADRDPIRAVIRGAAINNDGAAKIGFTAPSAQGQAEVVAMAQQMGEVDPRTIGYVEAHGTGTQLGDPIEVSALTEVFRAATDEVGFCALGSLKSNLGHMNSAAGVGGLIKAVLALEHRQIPPSLHYRRPNPAIDFAASPFFVNDRLRDWTSQAGQPLRAAVSSFGVGGTNAHVVLEQAPEVAAAAEPGADPGAASAADQADPPQVLVWSAHTPAALNQATERLHAHLRAHPGQALADVAWTLQVGRKPLAYRRSLVVSGHQQALTRLARPVEAVRTEPGEHPVVFLLPGQGAQYAGMARDLYRSEAVFADALDRCFDTLGPELDLRGPMFGDDPHALRPTAVAQPAIYAVSWALARLWRAWGVEPEAMLGHSVGEYVAAALAGVFSMEDGLRLVAARGRMIQDMAPGAMLAVMLAEADARRLAGELGTDAGGVEVAAVNAPQVTVVSGTIDAIERYRAALAVRQVGCTALQTSHAFHSRMMEPMLAGFGARVGQLSLAAPAVPIVSSLHGDWLSDQDARSPDYWTRHVRAAVRFSPALRVLLEDPQRVYLEVGPGRTLTALARRHRAGVAVFPSLPAPHEAGGRPDRVTVREALGGLACAGVEPDWQALAGRPRRRVALPTIAFQRERYWQSFDLGSLGALGPGAATGPAAGWASGHQVGLGIGAALPPREPMDRWLYHPSWRRGLPVRAPLAPARWLLLVDRPPAEPAGPWTEQWVDQLADRLSALRVTVGDGFARTETGYVLDPASRDDWRALFDAVEVDRVLHLTTLDAATMDFAELQRRGLYALLAMALARGDRPLSVTVLTRGLWSVAGEAASAALAPLAGAARVLGQELPQVTVRVVDLAAAERPTAPAVNAEPVIEPVTAPVTALVTELVTELAADEPFVALRGGQRWIEDMAPVPAHALAAEPPLAPGGVYLILGGLGLLGFTFAERLAAHQAKLVLVGRSGLVARDQWPGWLESHADTDPTSRRIRRILALEEQGAQVLVLSADLADRERMVQVFAQTEQAFGPVDGVIHAAGVAGQDAFRAIQDTLPAHCEVHFRGRVLGTEVLAELLPDRARFCLLCSSLATSAGGVGLFAYAAANAYLDAFAAERARRGDPRWLAVGWDAWRPFDQGPAGPLGELGLTAEEGAAMFERVLRLGLPRVAVSTIDLAARIEHAGRPAARGVDAPDGGPAEMHARPELANDYIEPRDPLERAIAEVWQQLFRIEPIGVEDNFFMLGGDSLMAIQLATRLREQLGVELVVNDLFEQATVASLARKVEALRSTAAEPAQAGAGSEEMAEVLAMVEGLSDDEVSRLLAEMDK